MKTLGELYCAKHRCSPKEALRRIFWASLHRRALLITPLRWIFGGRFFYADLDLIARCGQADRLAQVKAEMAEYWFHPLNRGLLRRMGFRISTRRLGRIARAYLQG